MDRAEPAAPSRPGLREAVVAFRYRNFTLFWIGAVLSNTGTWVQNFTVPYVVFQMTGSAGWVGFAGFAVFVPIVAVGPLAGSLADRYPRRTILLATQGAQAVFALTLFALWVTGPPPLGVLLAVLVASGFVTGLFIPSWQAFVSELVPREVLLNAVTLNSAQFNAAAAFGPAIGGFVLSRFGAGGAFLVNAVSYACVLVALGAIRVAALPRARHDVGVLRQFADAFRYARTKPGIVACFVSVVALGAFGMPVVLFFTVFAEQVFVVDDVGYGFLGAALGLGGVAASPLVAGRGSSIGRSRIAFASMLAYGAALALFGLAPSYAAALVFLFVAGAGYLGIASTLNTTIQLQVDEIVRGKVMAVYIMFLTVSYPVGSLLQGLLAQALGVRAAVTLCAGLFLAVMLWLRYGSGLLAHMDDEATPTEPPRPA